jgi:glycolate oxidase FAD binding subunit
LRSAKHALFRNDGLLECAVTTLSPATDQELADAISSATKPLLVESHGSKRGLGQVVDAADTLSLAKFSGVSLYEPEELVIEAGAATPLDEIEALADKHNQRLAFEPPNLARVLGSNSRGSLGSVLACNLAGPRRITAGAARDHILGVRGVSGRGEIFKAGGRVVKNVTGYDVAKLMAGSFGTLAAITSVTFKVLPKAETEITLLASLSDVHAAGRLMRLAMQSPYDVSCAAYVPARGVGLRLEGISASVEDRRQSLIKHLNHAVDVLDETASRAFWRGVRDLDYHAQALDTQLWRISVAPTEGPALAERLARETGGRYSLDWSGGLLWLEVPNKPDGWSQSIRARVGSGHATLIRASENVRRVVDVFQPQPAALAALTQRTKHAFDPKGLLNPGKMVRV